MQSSENELRAELIDLMLECSGPMTSLEPGDMADTINRSLDRLNEKLKDRPDLQEIRKKIAKEIEEGKLE